MSLNLKHVDENSKVAEQIAILNRLRLEAKNERQAIETSNAELDVLKNNPKPNDLARALTLLDGGESGTQRSQVVERLQRAENRLQILMRGEQEQIAVVDQTRGNASRKAAREAWPEFQRAAHLMGAHIDKLLEADKAYRLLRSEFERLGYNLTHVPATSLTESTFQRLKTLVHVVEEDAINLGLVTVEDKAA